MIRRRVALDSCSILHLLTQTQEWMPHLVPIFEDAQRGRIEIVVSEVSVTETTRLDVQGGKPVTPAESAKLISQFFRHAFIERRSVTARESEFAAQLIGQHGLGTCDALIAATAALGGAEVLYTTDGCSPRRKAGKLLAAATIDAGFGRTMDVCPPDAAEYAKRFNQGQMSTGMPGFFDPEE